MNPKTREVENRSMIVVREYDAKNKKAVGLPILAKLGDIRGNEVIEEMVDPRKRVTFYFVTDNQSFDQYVGDEFKLGDEKRGEDVLVVQDADPVKKTVTVKTANNTLEYIKPIPEDLVRPAGSEGIFEGPPEEMMRMPEFRRNDNRSGMRNRRRNR